jgi:hypothetical protein
MATANVSVAYKPRWVVGIVGGIVAFLIGSGLSFALLQLVGPATVYNDEYQSEKLSAVWDDTLWEAPRMMSDPVSFIPVVLALGVAQGLVFVLVGSALPNGVVKRGLTYGLILWLLSHLSFELLGPFNLLLEPLPLVGVELAVGLVGNLLAGITLSAIYARGEPQTGIEPDM